MPSHPIPAESLTERFRNTIRRHGMWTNNDRLLIGISGGADSIALARLVMQLGMQPSLAHVNFQLRGEESEGDEAFVRDFAAQHHLTLYVHRANTAQIARERRQSIQKVARRIRYDWWADLVREKGYTRILTGHQADDQLETMLVFLLRGGATTSFAGIPYKRGNICRPMLDLSREEIIQFLEAHRQEWREDSSNLKNTYLRNQIRQEVMPALARIRPDLLRHISHTAQGHQQIYLAARAETDRLLAAHSEWSDSHFKLDLDALLKVAYHTHVLHQSIFKKGFTTNQIENILQAAKEGRSGALFQAGDWEATLHRGLLEGRRKMPQPEPHHYIWPEAMQALSTPHGMIQVTDTVSGAPHTPDTGTKYRIWVDGERLIWPLVLRSRRPGDRIRPLGMQGSKKVVDILNEAGLNAYQKERVLLLCQGQEILWVPGLRMAECLRTGPHTRRSFLVEWLPFT